MSFYFDYKHYIGDEDLPTLSTLDLFGSSSQVANNWKKWKRAFEYYAEGKGSENTRIFLTSRLLHYAGIEVQDIFEDLVDPDPAGDADPYAVWIRKQLLKCSVKYIVSQVLWRLANSS